MPALAPAPRPAPPLRPDEAFATPPPRRWPVGPLAVALVATALLHTGLLFVPVNQPPEFRTAPEARALTGLPYRYDALVTDRESRRLAFRLVEAPPWLAGQATGEDTFRLAGTPPPGAQGNFRVALDATDAGGLTQRQSFVLEVGDLTGLGALLEQLLPPEPAQQRYVEATTAPENEPAETENFSNKDQRAADDNTTAAVDPDRNPFNDGDEAEANRLRRGQQGDAEAAQPQPDPTPPTPATPPPTPAAPPAAELRPQEVAQPTLLPPAPQAPPGLTAESPQILSGEGVASYLDPAKGEKPPEQPPAPATAAWAALNAENTAEQAAQPPAPATPARRPTPQRPRVPPSTLAAGTNGETLRNLNRAGPAGALAMDANFSEFGEYLAEVFGIIELHWHNLAASTVRLHEGQREVVVIEFFINAEGEVEDATVVTSSGSRAAELAALDGIQGRAPFRPWTEAMKGTLGTRQPLRIRFSYY